ncbi:MAG: glycosyltransferase, partial [Xanthomonas perforans]|nr:glycosyltransferase [Xanthomonas perforans]
DQALWPSVDVFIPTYNEPLSVVRTTVLAASVIDWPAGKITIHLLDDGRRDAFRDFCAEVGINYVTRTNNAHAKAGNINAALKKCSGEYVAIFDCDHIPTRSFLQVAMG